MNFTNTVVVLQHFGLFSRIQIFCLFQKSLESSVAQFDPVKAVGHGMHHGNRPTSIADSLFHVVDRLGDFLLVIVNRLAIFLVLKTEKHTIF
jgi:hypothetical protein